MHPIFNIIYPKMKAFCTTYDLTTDAIGVWSACHISVYKHRSVHTMLYADND